MSSAVARHRFLQRACERSMTSACWSTHRFVRHSQDLNERRSCCDGVVLCVPSVEQRGIPIRPTPKAVVEGSRSVEDHRLDAPPTSRPRRWSKDENSESKTAPRSATACGVESAILLSGGLRHPGYSLRHPSGSGIASTGRAYDDAERRPSTFAGRLAAPVISDPPGVFRQPFPAPLRSRGFHPRLRWRKRRDRDSMPLPPSPRLKPPTMGNGRLPPRPSRPTRTIV